MIVRSESQAAADAAALAAASQLDGTPSAITRANAALADFVTNAQRLASTGAGAVGIAQVRYLSGLPADDASPITDDLVTTDPLQARFVEITTAPLTQLNTFLLAVGAGDGATITTQAVAGCHQMVCRTLSLMRRGEPLRAVEAFDEAPRLDHGLATAANNRRIALAQAGQYDAALAGVSERDLPLALNNVAVVAARRGDRAVADRLLAAAVTAAPRYYELAVRNREALVSPAR